jgi:hypothetical protein
MWKPRDHQNLDHYHGVLLLVLITRASDPGHNHLSSKSNYNMDVAH